jgi:hypothetical protein
VVVVVVLLKLLLLLLKLLLLLLSFYSCPWSISLTIQANDEKMKEVMQKRLQEIKSASDYVPSDEFKGLGN